MEMANKDPCYASRRGVCKDKLPLRSLTRIKKESLIIPTKKVGAVVARSCRLLAGRSQDDNIMNAQELLQAKKEKRPKMAPMMPPLT